MSHNEIGPNGIAPKLGSGLIVMNDRTPHIGGEPVATRLAADLPNLVKAVLTEVVARVPGYQQLPVEELSGDISRVIHHTLQSFIAVLRSGVMPNAEELAFLRESAARRADEGLPIDVVLTAYHVGVQVIWDSLATDVRPEEVADVMALQSTTLRYLELITPTVAAGYLEQRQSIYGDEHSARHTLLTALLDGQPPAEEAAGQAGVRLPPSYLVLSLALGKHPDEGQPGIDPGVVARRKLRRLRNELERRTHEPALSSLTVDGGTVLLPVSVPAEHLSTSDWTTVGELTATMSKAAGVDITVGATAAEPTAVSSAAKTAREVLQVAMRAGRPPGVYRLDDVLLEYQLARPGAARERLGAVLNPLADSPELLETLAVYLRLGGRRPTAGKLHVHPNTIDYRLRRIQELTGLDATHPADISTLSAALAARRMATSDPD